jgi:hypothetical protein
LYVFAIWDLTVVALGPVSRNVVDIAYSNEEALLLLAMESGEIHAAQFAVAQ